MAVIYKSVPFCVASLPTIEIIGVFFKSSSDKVLSPVSLTTMCLNFLPESLITPLSFFAQSGSFSIFALFIFESGTR